MSSRKKIPDSRIKPISSVEELREEKSYILGEIRKQGDVVSKKYGYITRMVDYGSFGLEKLFNYSSHYSLPVVSKFLWGTFTAYKIFSVFKKRKK